MNIKQLQHDLLSQVYYDICDTGEVELNTAVAVTEYMMGNLTVVERIVDKVKRERATKT